MTPLPGERYARSIRRHAVAVLAATALLVAASAYLAAFHLPLDTDLASLLPPDVQSVRDMRRLEVRVPSQDAVLTLVVAPTPELRAATAADVIAGYRELGDDLVARLEVDDRETREFYLARLPLFVPLDELEQARDALGDAVRDAKLDANPLYIDLEDDDDDAAAAAEAEGDAPGPIERVEALREQAEQRLAKSAFVSDDGLVQLIIMRTAFSRTDLGRGERLRDAMAAVRARALAAPGREQVRVGVTGGVIDSMVEKAGLIKSMALSATITGLLVLGILWLYYRSVLLVGLLSTALVAGTMCSFGVTALVVGHLNLATAFLVAIVAGNGVNYGVLLLGRYQEERGERQRAQLDAMAIACAGTVRPTMVASMGAVVAYGSLAFTSFRGFSEFAVIGGVGMVLCWLAAFTTLPALVLVADRRTQVAPRPERLGTVLAAMFGRLRPGGVYAGSIAVALAAGWVTYAYVASDPFEYDVSKLRSNARDATDTQQWKAISNQHFGRSISGSTYIAVDRPEQVPLVIDALRAVDTGRLPDDARVGSIRSVEDVIPRDQSAKLVVLDEIRSLLDDPALNALADDELAKLREQRPADDLRAITADDLPDELMTKLRERDGRFGLLIAVRPGPSLEMWDGRDLIFFADLIREVRLADASVVTTSGSSVIFADIIEAIRVDGPRATAVAALAILVMVLLTVGANRGGAGVLLATGLGTLVMVASAALLGIKVNFLDFVALPITLGLGVDYAVNIAHRGGSGAVDAPLEALRTSGAAVLTCSATTIVAYGSLLISDNAGVRSFGLASLIGEVCCVVASMVLVPALVAGGGRRRARAA